MRTTTIIATLVLASLGASARADYYNDFFPFPPAYQRPERPICRKVEGGFICDVQRLAPIELREVIRKNNEKQDQEQQPK